MTSRRVDPYRRPPFNVSTQLVFHREAGPSYGIHNRRLIKTIKTRATSGGIEFGSGLCKYSTFLKTKINLKCFQCKDLVRHFTFVRTFCGTLKPSSSQWVLPVLAQSVTSRLLLFSRYLLWISDFMKQWRARLCQWFRQWRYWISSVTIVVLSDLNFCTCTVVY